MQTELTDHEVRELIRRANICLVCGQYGGGHLYDCPAHDERTCLVCREPVQIAVAFEYEPEPPPVEPGGGPRRPLVTFPDAPGRDLLGGWRL